MKNTPFENFNIGDHVILHDEEFYGRRTDDPARSFKSKGTGYKITAITKNFIECTNQSRDDADRTSFYCPKTVHYVEVL